MWQYPKNLFIFATLKGTLCNSKSLHLEKFELIAQLDEAFVRARPWKLWSRLLAYLLFEGRPLTTKGQWFNPVVFGFFKFCRFIPSRRLVTDPLFIVGMGRSGTTALGSVLSMHKDIAYLNEPKALWHTVNDNDDLIGSYSDANGQYRLSPDSVDPKNTRAISSVYRTLLQLTRSKRVVDKYPELLFRIPYVLKLFPDAKFIVLTRNGVDNCRSISRWCDDHGVDTQGAKNDWWGKDDRKWRLMCDQLLDEHDDLASSMEPIKKLESNFDKACVEWTLTSREAKAALLSHSEQVFRVDYDDLCSDPVGVLEKLIPMLDLSLDDDVFFEYAKITLAKQRSSSKATVLDPSVKMAFTSTMIDLGYEM